MKFDLSYVWHASPADVRQESHAATMADLMIAVDDRIFTANEPLHSVEDGHESRSFVTVSVFPLAEFIAANWWPLLHEPMEKEGLLRDAGAFKDRHWIDRHTDGFAYPTVGFFGADSSIRIAARAAHIEAANIQFPVTSGDLTTQWEGIERAKVETALLAFLCATIQRLPGNPDRDWLADAVERIEHARTTPDEEHYCRCAGLLGADPHAPGDAVEAAITQTVSLLGEDVAMELFATTELNAVRARASWIDEQTRRALTRSRAVAEHAHGLKQGVALSFAPSHKPWDRGYEAARQVRDILGITPDRPLSRLDDVANALLGAPSPAATTIQNLESTCGVRGLAREGADGLGMAIDPQSGRDPRFQLASTFSDFLFSPHGPLFLTTGASTDRQKRNRAFAAEFLAPIAGIRAKFSPARSPGANLHDIAQDFGVSKSVIRYQLHNQAPDLLDAA